MADRAEPLVVTAARTWWRLKTRLLAPVATCLALYAPVAAAGLAQPESVAVAWLKFVAVIGLSWLGLCWTAALVAGAGRPSGKALSKAVVVGLLKALVIYGPVALWVALGAAMPIEPGRPSLLPAATLLLLPLSAVMGAAFALAPVAALGEPGGPLAVLERARRLGDRVFWSLLLVGGALLSVALLGSILPGTAVEYYPNAALGSLLWVFVAVAGERARRLEAAEPA